MYKITYNVNNYIIGDFMFKEKMLKLAKEYLYIIAGTIFMAISTSLILLPNQLSTGGFSGIGTIIYYLLHYPVGTTMIVLNVPLLLIAFLKLIKVYL